MWEFVEGEERGREAGRRRESRPRGRKSAVVKLPVLSKHGTRTDGHIPCYPGSWLVPEPPTEGCGEMKGRALS